jgi:hypothetical protein
LKTKTANIAGLQVADLLAYPLKQQMLMENKRLCQPDNETFGQQLCSGVKDKYNKQQYTGKVYGYGKVFIK